MYTLVCVAGGGRLYPLEGQLPRGVRSYFHCSALARTVSLQADEGLPREGPTDVSRKWVVPVTPAMAHGSCFISIWGAVKALKPSPGFGQPRKGPAA